MVYYFNRKKERSSPVMTFNSPQGSAEKKAQVQDYFSRTAENYVAATSFRMGSDLQKLLTIGEWEPQQIALDVATGGGHTALAVAPYVGQIVVTDLTPRMLEKAREYILAQGVTNAQFQTADAEQLPFADASFDRVTCRIAPHHFPDVAKAVREIARVLKPGGLFLLIDNIVASDPELDNAANTLERWRDPSHVRAYTVEEWERFFSQAGLQIEYKEIMCKSHNYDEWTARAQLPDEEKARLEQYILHLDERIQRYFEVKVREDGHLESLHQTESILLKGRKI
jgi:ubiquinone/menaquinone biosynthesis C-methylase UbiE